MCKHVVIAIATLALVVPIKGTTLYSFGPDLNNGGVPDNFSAIGTDGTIGTQVLVGDGSIGFDGGLVYNPSNSLFSAIGNSGAGPGLYSFSTNGASSLVGSIDPNVGWFFGLAGDTGNGSFYAVGDNQGTQSLYTVDGAGDHFVASVDSGVGPYSGIVYVPDTGQFYGIVLNFGGGADAVYGFGVSGGPPTFLFSLDGLGGNHLGGLAYAGNGIFYSIESTGNAEAELLSFNAAGTILSGPVDMNTVGFENHGIAVIAASNAPEPATVVPVGLGLLAAGLLRIRRARR